MVAAAAFVPGPGVAPVYAAYTPANCRLTGVAWWDGSTYQANGQLATRADLTSQAQAMISAGGAARQSSVVTADGARWLLVYNPSNASVTVYRCTGAAAVVVQPQPGYYPFGPGFFADGFREGLGFGPVFGGGFPGFGFGGGFGHGFGGGGFGGRGGFGGGGFGGGGGRGGGMRGIDGVLDGVLGALKKPIF